MELVLGILRGGGLDPARTHLLDAGCGTGSYLAALVGQVGRLTGVELEPGMLRRAAAKLQGVGHIRLLRGSVTAMPLADATVDAVMFNQVLHHLDSGEGEGATAWPNLRRTLAESHRVLRPGGVLIINTCTQEQVLAGSWYNALIQAAARRMARRYIPLDVLSTLLCEVGFMMRGTALPRGEVFGARGLDPTAPFDEAWRQGDSIWALATDDELAAALDRLRALHAAGQAEAFVREHDRRRQTGGQAVFVQAWRG